MIHPSSVNHRRKENTEDHADERQLYAFADKRRNESTGSSAVTFMVTTTRLDVLTYILFGAHDVNIVERGLECDNWLPIVGDVKILDDIQQLKTFMEASMLRVFEGIAMSRLRRGQALPVRPREEDSESESWDEEDSKKNYTLSLQEVGELDYMTRDVVNILNRHNVDRIANQQSRAATPSSSQNSRLPRRSASGHSTYSTPNFTSRLR
jgi:small subunit ribosomal protein S24e